MQAQKDEEKQKSSTKQLRISNPILVVKNPIPVSASDQALFDAKAAITGEKLIFTESEDSRSSLSLSVFEGNPAVPQVTVCEVKSNGKENKPTNSSPLSARARSASGRVSPLSNSLEFQQHYPRLSHDFNNLSGSRNPAQALQDLPVRTSTARHANTRLSLGLNSARNSAVAPTNEPEASESPKQQPPPSRPSIATSRSSSITSSTPLRPSSLRTSIPTPQLPAPVHHSPTPNTSAPRGPKLIIPPTPSQPSEPNESTTSPSLTAPQPYNPRNSACAPEVVPSEPSTPPSSHPLQPKPVGPTHSSSTPNLRGPNVFNPDGSVSQSFTLNQAFPNLGRPSSYRGVEQGSWRPGSGGVSPQMLRMSNARRLDETFAGGDERVNIHGPNVHWVPAVGQA